MANKEKVHEKIFEELVDKLVEKYKSSREQESLAALPDTMDGLKAKFTVVFPSRGGGAGAAMHGQTPGGPIAASNQGACRYGHYHVLKMSRQVLMNDLDQVSSVSLLMTALTALTNKGLF